MEFAVCCLNTPGHGACPGEWLTDPVTVHWRKVCFSSFQRVLNTNNLLVMGGTPCLYPHFSAGTLSGLNPGRICACRHNLCEFTGHLSCCAWKTGSLESSITSSSFKETLEPRREGLGPSPKSFTLCTLSGCGSLC